MLDRHWRVVFFCCAGWWFLVSSLTAQDSDEPTDLAPGLHSELLSGLEFRSIGPALMSGRIADIVIPQDNRSTWYVAAASGGVWKTVNAGTTWEPIFDGYGSYSIGCLAIDPQNPHVIWVGTGENNSQRSVGYGDGLYKSLDGGKSFQRMGLQASEHIAKILIHPKDSNTIYVASQGPLWKSGGDRGLFKSTDGGATFTPVLEISPDTGVTDVVMDPRDPETLYAASYQRRRHVWTLINGGPEGGLHKSTDGGKSWRKVQRGLPGGDLGRIGLAISPINPDVVYAIVEATEGKSGFYRSADRGETWSRESDYVTTSPQYYQEIVADPHQFDRIYALDTYLMVSDDGGRTFVQAGERNKHVDNHALIIDPYDPNHLIVGCDGGLYETWDRCATYRYCENLPLTQFYKIAVDNSQPFYYVYGGTQDNATQGGPSRTSNAHGIRNSDWFITVFGDGFAPAVDPEDPNIVYSQWQYGGLVRYDRRTGEQMDIKPREEKEGPPLRWNWDSPLLISPHRSKRLYYASQILFRSDDGGESWTAISPDLTRNLDRNALKVMGRVWGVDSVAKNNSTSFYGNIVAVTESPRVENLLYVGTDDGLIQVSEDGGANWRKIESFPHLQVPEFAYVSDLEASQHDPNVVYAVLQNFKRGDFKPYVLKSTDRGVTWIEITGDLPQRGSAYTIVEDHLRPGLLFVGTEFGVYTTLDDGGKWIAMKGGLPTISVRDLKIQKRENDLVVGTFGRGIYILDNYSPLRALSTESLEKEAEIYAIKDALMYIPQVPLAIEGKAFQGASFYTADNPPFGATITYRLKESLQTARGARKKREGEAGAGGDVPYPSWEELKNEDREEEPLVMLTIRDAAGEVVRRLRGRSSSGIHRVAWDFRYPGLGPSGRGEGPMAVPGTYTVDLSVLRTKNRAEEEDKGPENGTWETLVQPVAINCIPQGMAGLDPAQRAASLQFQRETAEVQRVLLAAYEVLQAAQQRVAEIKELAARSGRVPLELRDRARALELKMLDLQARFTGDPTKPKRSEPELPGLIERLQVVIGGHWSTSQSPTQTHRKQYQLVVEAIPELLDQVRQAVDGELPALEAELDKVAAPWTPGRKIPAWPPK